MPRANSLEEILWIFSYKMGSRSAIALADACDSWIIKHQGSTFTGRSNKFILNWGAGTGVFNCNAGAATVLNTPQQVDAAINKKSFFSTMLGPDAPRLPYWTTQKLQAQAWASSGEVIVARTVLEGMKGAGIVLCKNVVDIPDASLYTVKVSNQTEYRVYMFNGKVIDYRVKLVEQGGAPDADNMRFGEQYEYVDRGNEYPLPLDVQVQAEKAIKKSGLFTGGIDVVFDGTKAYVLEINTAPYVGDNTAEKYAVALREYITEVERNRRAA